MQDMGSRVTRIEAIVDILKGINSLSIIIFIMTILLISFLSVSLNTSFNSLHPKLDEIDKRLERLEKAGGD